MLSRAVLPARAIGSVGLRAFATGQAGFMDRSMGHNQWYIHMSRTEGADVNHIKSTLQNLRTACATNGVGLTIAFGPTLLKDVTDQVPEGFEAYPGYKAADGSGREAKATQEEMLLWLHHDDKGKIWQAQYDCRQALTGHMKVARETPTFNYGPGKDMTGFIDGTGNPEASQDAKVALVPNGQKGAGGAHLIAQRWVHDLVSFNKLSVPEQEAVFGRTKNDSSRLEPMPAQSHVAHHELLDSTGVKRGEMTRRSTGYAFHDGNVGLYFIGFCKEQAPLHERMVAMYGLDGQIRDGLTDYSQPASGSFYFAPSVEVLDAM